MKTTATALCALLLAAPAWAQQDVFRNDRPETRVTPTERPPRDTSRSEGVNIGQERGGQISPQVHQALNALSRNAVAAQQFGNLAASKQAPADIRDLGDRMVVANSEINERLDAVSARLGVELPQRMPASDQAFFEALAETNQDEFARGLVAWVNEVYPKSIRALQAMADDPALAELSRTAIPALRDQLRASQQMAQAYFQGGPMQAEMPDDRIQPRGGDQPVDEAGRSYRREPGPVDPQSRTQAPPGGDLAAIPAGEPAVTNAGGLLAAIANADEEVRQLGMTSDIEPEQVRIVPAQEALPSGDVGMLRDSVRDNQDQIDRLRRAIGQEDALNRALEGGNVSPGDVIAMDVMDEGVVLYTLGPQQAETPAR